jgi:hypothetical protein
VALTHATLSLVGGVLALATLAVALRPARIAGPA